MSIDLSFKEVRAFVEGDQPRNLLDAADVLLGVAIICLPVAFGPLALPALGVIAAKNELVTLGKSLLDAVAGKKDADLFEHQQRMEVAYTLLCYTAFFEALDRNLPDDIRKAIGLLSSEKESIAKNATRKACIADVTAVPMDDAQAEPRLPRIPYPHPAIGHKQQTQVMAALYGNMASGFVEFVKQLEYWEHLDAENRKTIEGALQQTEKDAVRYYKLQYGEMCRRSTDFNIWANLNEHRLTKAEIAELSDTMRGLAELSRKNIDIGFARLQQVVQSIPKVFETRKAARIVDALRRHYESRIDELIVEDRNSTEGSEANLSFPRIRDAFIPQSFKVIRRTASTGRLEPPETWANVEARDDLGAFLLSYLDSPHSTENPLIVLGHPGSGKSLLTKVLSAALMSEYFTPVRVQLRNVDADTQIHLQIQREIENITHDKLDSWASFAHEFHNCPPVIILDGYDELLQASGKVFAGYLQQVKDFQATEAELGRPVRTIVTSRLTLIDKATIPEGATIVRLLEFDRDRQKKWISVWNGANRTYFRERGIQSFELPKEDDPDSKNVLTLAGQPLLLLMLALYDSDGNRLKQSAGLDRTVLYDSLLRKFVRREREKDPDFSSGPDKEKEQEDEIDQDMQRLGVAAMGMYNRRKLHISGAELDKDLAFFGLERDVKVESGLSLSQAHMLLGSFFFVHKSKTQQKTDGPDQTVEVTAFEFLHNTFGEFLTADFILRQLLRQTEAISSLSKQGTLKAELMDKLSNPDRFSDAWYSCLSYTPLFSRAVVLQMLTEWATHSLKARRFDRAVFIKHLDDILSHHLRLILQGSEMASIMCGKHQTPFGHHPLLGHLSTYSLNLVTLRALLAQDGYTFKEEGFQTEEEGARPWDRLTHIWRAWFSLDGLRGLAALISAERSGNVVKVLPQVSSVTSDSRDTLENVLDVSLALGDGITAGLAGLLSFDSSKNATDLARAWKSLSAEDIDLTSHVLLKQAQAAFYAERPVGEEVERTLKDILGIAAKGNANDDLRTALAVACLFPLSSSSWMTQELLDRFLFRIHPDVLLHQYPEVAALVLRFARVTGNPLKSPGRRHEWVRYFHHLIGPPDILERYPELALEVLRFIRDVKDPRWLDEFGGEWMHYAFRSLSSAAPFERYPDLALEMLRLVREIRNPRWMRNLGAECLHNLFRNLPSVDMSELYPDLALEILRLIREIGDPRWMEEFGWEWLGHLVRHLTPTAMFERDPDMALEVLRLIREIGQHRWAEQIGQEWLRRCLRPMPHMQGLEQYPDLALEMLRLAIAVGDDEWAHRLQRASPRLLDDIVSRMSLSVAGEVRQWASRTGNEYLLVAIDRALYTP